MTQHGVTGCVQTSSYSTSGAPAPLAAPMNNQASPQRYGRRGRSVACTCTSTCTSSTATATATQSQAYYWNWKRRQAWWIRRRGGGHGPDRSWHRHRRAGRRAAAICRSALHLAAIYDHIDIVRELIRAGAALDVKDMGGRTALQWAQLSGKYDTVEALLAAGASNTQ